MAGQPESGVRKSGAGLVVVEGKNSVWWHEVVGTSPGAGSKSPEVVKGIGFDLGQSQEDKAKPQPEPAPGQHVQGKSQAPSFVEPRGFRTERPPAS